MIQILTERVERREGEEEEKEKRVEKTIFVVYVNCSRAQLRKHNVNSCEFRVRIKTSLVEDEALAVAQERPK